MISKKGRRFYAEITEVRTDGVTIRPLGPGVSYRQATAHEVLELWRRSRRRGEAAQDATARDQLSLTK